MKEATISFSTYKEAVLAKDCLANRGILVSVNGPNLVFMSEDIKVRALEILSNIIYK